MLTYDQAKVQLGNRKSKKLGHETWLEARENAIAVRYHRTDVVTIHEDNTYELNNGGWATSTTKKRLNQYSPAKIYQHKYSWYLWTPEGPVSYFNGIKVNSFGEVLKEVLR